LNYVIAWAFEKVETLPCITLLGTACYCFSIQVILLPGSYTLFKKDPAKGNLQLSFTYIIKQAFLLVMAVASTLRMLCKTPTEQGLLRLTFRIVLNLQSFEKPLLRR